MKSSQYTIVQHSGYGYGGDPMFKRGLEIRTVQEADVRTVTEAGGLIFEDWNAADDYCDVEMYRNSGGSMLPQAPGSFSRRKVGGLRIYQSKPPGNLAGFDAEGSST